MVNTNGRLKSGMTALVGALALMSIAAPVALAQSSSQEGYNGESPVGQVDDIAPNQQGELEGSGDAVTGESVSTAAGGDGGGALPFTGTDLGILLVLGLALAGTGLLVRRAARSPGS